jgi:hypothetical protein
MYQFLTTSITYIIIGSSIVYAVFLVRGIFALLAPPYSETFSEWSDRKEKEFIQEQAALRTQQLIDMGIPKDLHKITDI